MLRTRQFWESVVFGVAIGAICLLFIAIGKVARDVEHPPTLKE